MKSLKSTKLMSVFLTILLCAMSVTPVWAQSAGTGVDPNAVMLDDFETGSYSKWTPRPGTRGEKVTFEMMNASNGDLVRFGNHALKVNLDFTSAQENQTLVGQISPATLKIPGNGTAGGKRLGMWVYATPGVQGMWFRISTRKNGSTSGVTNTDLASSINWTGWKYVQCDLPTDHEFHPDGIRFLVLKGYSNYFVNGYVIIDNIRVTNKSVTEDLVAPLVSSLTGNGTNLSGTYNTGNIDVVASFKDDGVPSSGINYNSIYYTVDGYLFKSGDTGFSIDEAANTVSLKGINLSNGTHEIVAHIEDNFGNIGTKTGTFTIDATDGRNTAVTVAPGTDVYVGKPYEIKINTNNSKDVKELDMVIELNSYGTVNSVDGVTFAPSAQNGSSFDFNSRNGYLTIKLKNDISAAATETLATIKVDISKNSNPTDVLRCNPVSAKAIYSDNSLSLFSLFSTFTRNVKAQYDYSVVKRIVGAPGEIKATDLNGMPLAGATVYALNANMTSIIDQTTTDANGIASGMTFTNTAQGVNIYVEKDGNYSYTKLVRTLNPLLSSTPSYIRAGITADPKTSKTITWMSNPVLSKDGAILKIAKKVDGETSFREVNGTSKVLEYNAVVSNGVTKASAVTVNDLEPGTTYIYKVGDGTNWSATHEFTTITPSKKFSFSAYGDLQATSNSSMGRFIAAGKTLEALSEKPIFSLNVGDVVDSDDRYDCYSYFGYLLDECPGFANIDMVSAYGNHEYMGNPDADNMKFTNGHHTVTPSDKYDAKIVGTGTFATEYENMIVLALDWAHKGTASPTEILTEQAKWMDEVLSKTDKTWKVVTLHYPIYPSESTPGAQNILGPVLDKHKVQIVFCGHGHTFERVQVYQGNFLVPTSDKRTFTPVIGGTLHFQLGDMTSAGTNARWILCDVDGKKMKFTVRDGSNNIVNTECFTLYAAPLDEFAVNFNSLDENGSVVAKVNNVAITSGDKVQECKEIVFTATPKSGFKVKEWKHNNNVINGTENSYTISSLDANSNVTVEFESVALGVDPNFSPNLKVYPNPFMDLLTISGAENSSFQIINIAGSVVINSQIVSSEESINLEKLLPGVYFLKIEKDNQSKTIKVIKK